MTASTRLQPRESCLTRQREPHFRADEPWPARHSRSPRRPHAQPARQLPGSASPFRTFTAPPKSSLADCPLQSKTPHLLQSSDVRLARCPTDRNSETRYEGQSAENTCRTMDRTVPSLFGTIPYIIPFTAQKLGLRLCQCAPHGGD